MARHDPPVPIPVVSVRGNHADLGRAMGSHQAPYIRRVVAAALEAMHEQETGERALAEQIAPYLDAAERIFPQYVEELRTMADAADVPFEMLFRLNCYESRPPGMQFGGGRGGNRQVPLPAKDPTVPQGAAPTAGPASSNGTHGTAGTVTATPGAAAAPVLGEGGRAPDGCTSVVSRGDHGVVLGHTEDSSPEAIDGLYLLDATVAANNGTLSAAIRPARFLALNYAQTLAGCAAAVNRHGLFILIDALPDPDRNVGVPRHMVSRALLECASIDDAIEMLRSLERGGGWNYLMAQGNRVVNVEATATRVVPVEVGPENAYAHSNHYRDPDLAAASGEPRPNSLSRLNRALDLVRPAMSLEEMKALLTDRQDSPDSICRERTIGAWVANTSDSLVHVCWGEPDTGIWSTYPYS